MPTVEAVNAFHSVTSNRLKKPILGHGFYWKQKRPRRPQIVIGRWLAWCLLSTIVTILTYSWQITPSSAILEVKT